MNEKIKHIFNIKKLGLRISRLIPRQHHLHGTIVHRIIGERLFDPRLWKPRNKSVSAGFAVGVFIALTPTIGVQIPLIILAALFMRVNIPVALAASWVTNPLTAPAIYPMQYKLGLWLCGAPNIDELAGYTGMLKIFIRYAKPLWMGSLISAICCSALGYAVIFSLWWLLSKLRKKTFHLDNKTTPSEDR